MSADRLALGRRTYLDANLYIYVFEGIETWRAWMTGLLAALDRQGGDVGASELLFTELLPRPMKEGRQEFVPLDDHYEAITFREPSRPGHELAPARDRAPLDLSCRRMA